MEVLTLIPNRYGFAPGQRGSIELWEKVLAPEGIRLHWAPFESERLREILYTPGHTFEKNLALLGSELIQFGRAEPLGARCFRLSRLLRGRYGTEWASSGHVAGEPFVLIEPETLLPIELPAALIGGEARVMAQGLGDDVPVTEIRLVTGEALRPPAPVHLRAQLHDNGDIMIAWVRRSRAGWSWLDGSDAPLIEESERYALRLSTATSTRSLESLEPAYLCLAADQAEDGGGPLTVEVTQLGTFAASRAASITVERS